MIDDLFKCATALVPHCGTGQCAIFSPDRGANTCYQVFLFRRLGFSSGFDTVISWPHHFLAVFVSNMNKLTEEGSDSRSDLIVPIASELDFRKSPFLLELCVSNRC